MSMDTMEVINALTSFQETNAKLIESIRTENREDHTRIHERLDALVDKGPVTGLDCENRRNQCRTCMFQKIDKAKGWPPWIAGIGAIATGLITGLIMNTLNK